MAHLVQLVQEWGVIGRAAHAQIRDRQRDRIQNSSRTDIPSLHACKQRFCLAQATGTGLLRPGSLPARASHGPAHAAYLAADRGWPVTTIVSGRVAYRDGAVVGEPSGVYLSRR